MAETETETRLLTYLPELEKLKPFHQDIAMILQYLIRMLKQSKIALTQTMNNINHHNNKIDLQLKEEELGQVYSNIPILNDTLPNYKREVKNLLTLRQSEIDILVTSIIDIINASNEKRDHIVEKPVEGKVKTEQERLDYEQIQKEDLVAMKDCPSRVRFDLLKTNILNRITNEEEGILTNNISSQLFGKNVEVLEWEKRRKK